MKKLLLALGLLLLAELPANAATCFWVGGTGTWSTSNTTSWASGTGGTGGTCAATGGVPKQVADTAIFDGSSGGGTVTPNFNIAITSITATNFTGTLDWSANNNNLTLINASAAMFVDATGGGAHTINMGSGTWSLSSGLNGGTSVNFTNASLTLNADTSTIVFTSTNTGATTSSWALGGKTFATATFNTPIGGSVMAISGANTFGTLNCSGGFAYVSLVSATTQTVTTTLNLTGISGTECIIVSGTLNTAATISAPASVASGSWVAFRDITFSTSAPTFSNCTNLGHNNFNGGSCTAPSGGGGGGFVGILGGGL